MEDHSIEKACHLRGARKKPKMRKSGTTRGSQPIVSCRKRFFSGLEETLPSFLKRREAAPQERPA